LKLKTTKNPLLRKDLRVFSLVQMKAVDETSAIINGLFNFRDA